MKRSTFFLMLLLLSPAMAQTLSPRPNSAVSAARPTISATFSSDIGQARIWVDGTEFTNYADRRSRTVILDPPYNLDYGTHRVQVRTGRGEIANWNFNIQRGAYTGNTSGWNQGGVTEVLKYGPPPGSVVTVTRPPVVAIFNGNVRSLRLTVDGVDVTGASRKQSSRITWDPGYDLDQGQHNCVVTGTAPDGQPVRGDWNFIIKSY